MEETDQKLSESETEEISDDDDDSEVDPTFDIAEETRPSLSRLSLKKKKTKSRISKVIQPGNESNDEGPDDVEVKVAELNAKDTKSYENVEKIIAAGQLEKLKVEQCKVYLRKNGLRLTGKKDVLIERITEHLGIIDGGGDQKYPVSSFVYNCKGDACTGDVVMFEQNVYEMYIIASRSATGPPCGTRTVAGRIVKESYGSAKQQHTFTIEVLWSKGEKPLPPLHPLLIKGRNLYKLKTMRQLWADEEMRRKVLLEKHSRGSLARSNRETRIKQKEMRKKSTSQRVLRNKRNAVQEKERRMSPDELGMENFLPVTAQLQNQLPAICTKQSTQFGHHKPVFPPKMVLTEVCMNTTMAASVTEHYSNQVDNGYQVANQRQNHMSEKVDQSYEAYVNANKLQHNGIREVEISRSSESQFASNTQQNQFSEKLHQSHHANANQSSFNAPLRNSIPGRAPSQRKIEPIPSGNLPPGFDSSTCRSVYVGNIHIQVTEPLLQEFFASTGPLAGCKLIRKEKSSYGFVDYYDCRSAALAILNLNGRHLSGRPLKVNWAYASCQRGDTSGHFNIFVGDLSPEVTDATLFACFSVYSSCSDARVMWDQKTGRSRGFGFVSFRNEQEAQSAINDLTGKWLGSRQIRCNWATKGAGVTGDKHNSDVKSMAEFSNRTPDDCQELKKEDAPETKLNNPQYTTVYVGNLAPEVTQLDLHRFFYALGAGVLEEVCVRRDKGFGFVRYSTHAEAALGIQMGSANILCGKAIKCSWGNKPTPPGTSSTPLPPPAEESRKKRSKQRRKKKANSEGKKRQTEKKKKRKQKRSTNLVVSH